MSEDVVREKLEKIFSKCDKHILRINGATKKMSLFMPLDGDKYEKLTEDEIESIDQFLFRFAKLQDAMGQKLFKTILIFLNEDIEGKPFIDILNLMEKLGLLEDKNEWKMLREYRNELSHNYEDEPITMSATINKLYAEKENMIAIYNKIKGYYNHKKGN